MKFSKEKESSIISDYKTGLNTVEIAKKWNTYNTSIRRVLLRNNIIPRTNKEVQTRVKINPFEIGDEKSEYFLGLLLTDGNIYHSKKTNSSSVSLSLKDKEMVEKFRDFICPRNKVSKILQKKYNTYMFSVAVKSDIIAEWLESKGNFINKSYNCNIYIPLTSNILRGIFDGDGYWRYTNSRRTMSWGICGKSLIFLEKIQDYLSSINIKSYLHKRNKNDENYLYYLEVHRTEDIIRIANLMYKRASIFLIRKYDKWHLFEETLREKFPKFKEGDTLSNPEPSYSNIEGAETIMGFLNT